MLSFALSRGTPLHATRARALEELERKHAETVLRYPKITTRLGLVRTPTKKPGAVRVRTVSQLNAEGAGFVIDIPPRTRKPSDSDTTSDGDADSSFSVATPPPPCPWSGSTSASEDTVAAPRQRRRSQSADGVPLSCARCGCRQSAT